MKKIIKIAFGCGHRRWLCFVHRPTSWHPKLLEYGIQDPDAQWGKDVLLRYWDEEEFISSLRAAEQTTLQELKRDGNRVVILCSTTDPYQVIRSRSVRSESAR